MASLNPLSWFNRAAPADPAAQQPDSPAWRRQGLPGPSHGLLAHLKQALGGGGYVGPTASAGTLQEREIVEEKAASGPRNVVFPWFLPYFDDFTGETAVMRLAYRRMFADPRVKTAVLGKLFGVASLDLKILPADKKNSRDKAIAKHVQWMLTERLRDTVPGLIWSILSGGLLDGYSICEKVWTLEDRGRYAGTYSLGKLKPKDAGNDVVLQTDEFKNVVAVQGLRYNAGAEFSPADFLIYRHLPLFDVPTGTSDLRAVYQSYWMLDTVTKLRAIAAEKNSIPLLLGSYANATVKTSLENALKQAKSQRWLSIPEACKIEAVNIAGSADSIFKEFVADLRHDIFLGIQGALLQSLEGETTDGRGNSQVHQSTADKFVWFLANSVESLLNDRECGLVKDIVDLNYVAGEYPTAKLSAVDVAELVQELQVDTGLHTLGLDLSKDEIYERYGRTPPEDDDDKLPGGQGPAPPGGAPGGGPAPPAPGGGSLPFGDVSSETVTPKLLPASEGPAATPFRGFSEEWRHYLAGRG